MVNVMSQFSVNELLSSMYSKESLYFSPCQFKPCLSPKLDKGARSDILP